METTTKQNNVIKGEIVKMRCFDGGYTILNVIPDKDSPIQSTSTWGATLVGNMPKFAEGMIISATVEPVEHAKYGLQYKMLEIQESGFNKAEALIDFLSSKLFNGIGPILAKKIVDKFGLDTLEILDDNPERILDVEGMSRSKCDKFIEQWKEQRAAHQALAQLVTMGMTMGMAMKAYSHFESSVVEIVKENPYSLIEIPSIGFHKADDIAIKMGVKRNSQYRVMAAISYLLDTIMWSVGHCYLTELVLVSKTLELLNNDVVQKEVRACLQTMESNLTIITEENRIYLSHVYMAEKSVAETLKKMLEYSDKKIYSSIDEMKIDMQQFNIMQNIKLADEQYDAIYTAVNSRVCIITGGPGTGKSTLTKAICGLLDAKKISYKLCAPTGRAAKRLSEATLNTAETIHRMLGFKNGAFEHDSTNPLMADCGLVDEVSMVDILLFRNLIDALDYDCRLIMVGDADQLPSVGPGNVLHDLIDSGIIPVVRLKTIFRQSKGSAIVDVAHQILHGEVPVLASPAKSGGKNCMLVTADDPAMLIEHVSALISTHLPKANIKHSDIQLLTPMRERGLGVNDFNPVMQQLINPPSPTKNEINANFRTLRVGDRVMHIHNDYKKEVFNGDIGLIAAITKDDSGSGSMIFVQYPDKDSLVPYDQSDWDDIVLAYASTVHKSQGGEYPVVILVLHPSQSIMLQRNLFYTGLTRARRLCIIVGTEDAIKTAVHNNKIQKRNTTLKHRLING